MEYKAFVQDLLQWNGPPSVRKYFSLALFLFGFFFYFIWNILWGRWADPGVYSVTVVTVLIGITGMILFTSQERRLAEA